MEVENKIRLQVFLSRNGVCSRRKAMSVVQEGHVSVNGKVIVEPSTPVDPKKDKVCVDGKVVDAKGYVYLMLHKPSGCVTTKSDRFADKTVLDLLPKSLQYVNPVGRLDKDTEGLLLLTNDGDLTNKLTHPRFHVDKTYFVKINGKLEPREIKRLEKGVVLEGKKTAPAKIKSIKTVGNQMTFSMTIHEGRKRQIRLMLEEVGHRVIYLKRIVQGPLKLGQLPRGKFRALTQKEVLLLKNLL